MEAIDTVPASVDAAGRVYDQAVRDVAGAGLVVAAEKETGRAVVDAEDWILIGAAVFRVAVNPIAGEKPAACTCQTDVTLRRDAVLTQAGALGRRKGKASGAGLAQVACLRDAVVDDSHAHRPVGFEGESRQTLDASFEAVRLTVVDASPACAAVLIEDETCGALRTPTVEVN